MSPVTHFLASWMLANTAPLERRERAIVALSGLAPDIDGLGLAVDLATRGTAWETNWWGEYHHTLGHNLLFALVAGTIALAFARSHRLKSFALAVTAVHLHLLCDVGGGRGPEGYQWPIPYLWPFAAHPQWVWSGQWALDAWPNLLITGICILVTLRLAWSRGFSPVELVCLRWDRKVVETLRQRFPGRADP
ncbi:MAG: metal-dependent hydrolase [Verrucomicrobia bacterium]|nr:metal-dependent hydrolase [Verrucomicrobiota bacterium]